MPGCARGNWGGGCKRQPHIDISLLLSLLSLCLKREREREERKKEEREEKGTKAARRKQGGTDSIRHLCSADEPAPPQPPGIQPGGVPTAGWEEEGPVMEFFSDAPS